MGLSDTAEQHNKKQEIDLRELAEKLWDQRFLLLKIVGITTLIGLVVAFSIPKEYTTTVQIAPETQSVTGGNNLTGLAALAGVNLNAQQVGADAILPSLYPNVVQSTPFLLDLLSVEVVGKDSGFSGVLYDYLSDNQETVWWSYIVQAPFQLLGAVTSLFKEEEKAQSGALDPFSLTRKQSEVLELLKNRISVAVDQKTSMISLTVKMQDPFISAQLVNVVLINLQTYITDYRTQKAKQDLEFTEKVLTDARLAYYDAQRNYAHFEDANRNIATASFRTEQERLSNEMSLTFNVYNTLAQKLEQDKLKVQEQTPVYTVIEPATVSNRASSPNKPLILIGFVCLALCGGIGWILFIKYLFMHDTQK